MDNSKHNTAEPGPEPSDEPQEGAQPSTEDDFKFDEWMRRRREQAKTLYKGGKEYYQSSPRLQKAVYQGKFMPAFWTVACIFSLVVNIILIGLLASIGHHFFELKAVVSNGLVTEASNNLAMMDQAHIVVTVPVRTTVTLQDSLPVSFDLPINQSTQLNLAKETSITNARIYLNNTAVSTDLTLPANTKLQADFNMSVPVSTTVPVAITVPVSTTVPVDIAIDQTDLHQSIIGLQEALKPYQTAMGSTFNSPNELAMCDNWVTGWLCSFFLGK